MMPLECLARNKCSRNIDIHYDFILESFRNEVEMEERGPQVSPVNNLQFHFLPDCLAQGSLCSVLSRTFS